MRTLFGLTLAAAVLTLAPQSASAWSHYKFGIGANYERSAGGNSFGKHLWHNGQIPNPYAGGYGGGFGGMPFDGHGQVMPFAQNFDHVPVAAPAPVAPAPHAAYGAPAQPASPFHYATHSNSGYYYPEPSYYYGQNYGYGYDW